MSRTPFAHILTLIVFIVNSFGPVPAVQAQEFVLPKPGVMVRLSPPENPAILKGIKVHPDNPFRFDFILDKGDEQRPSDRSLQEESTKLIKYFLASLTIPEKDLWVNLSPYEKDRIVPESFGVTEMGRDLLAQDYMLKQITASLIYPEDEVGKKFWKRIYEEAAKKYGNTNIPVNTFNKVWIVPEKAVVYENAKAGTAYVVESKLKVMLEEDYLALDKNTPTRGHADTEQQSVSPSTLPTPQALNMKATQGTDVNVLGSQIIREIVIPELTKEINEGKNFSQLRQVYNSLILATWYKKKIKDSILSKVYADRNKTKGIGINDVGAGSPSPNVQGGETPPLQDVLNTEKIYQQYLSAFKKGVYNYIKEEADPITQQLIPRKYFSGGAKMGIPQLDYAMDVPEAEFDKAQVVLEVNVTPDQAMAAEKDLRRTKSRWGGGDLWNEEWFQKSFKRSNISPTGLLLFGAYIPKPQVYSDILGEGIKPKSVHKKGGMNANYSPKHISLALSRDDQVFATSLSVTNWSPQWDVNNVVFIIDPNYVRAHTADFELLGNNFDEKRSTRSGYAEGLALLGLKQPRNIDRGSPFADEIQTKENLVLPPTAISGVIVHPDYYLEVKAWNATLGRKELPIYVMHPHSYPYDIYVANTDPAQTSQPEDWAMANQQNLKAIPFKDFKYSPQLKQLTDPQGNKSNLMSDGTDLIFEFTTGLWSNVVFRITNDGLHTISEEEKGFALGAQYKVAPSYIGGVIDGYEFLAVERIVPVEGTKSLSDLLDKWTVDDRYVKAVQDLFKTLLRNKLYLIDIVNSSNIVVGFLNGKLVARVVDAEFLRKQNDATKVLAQRYKEQILSRESLWSKGRIRSAVIHLLENWDAAMNAEDSLQMADQAQTSPPEDQATQGLIEGLGDSAQLVQQIKGHMARVFQLMESVPIEDTLKQIEGERNKYKEIIALFRKNHGPTVDQANEEFIAAMRLIYEADEVQKDQLIVECLKMDFSGDENFINAMQMTTDSSPVWGTQLLFMLIEKNPSELKDILNKFFGLYVQITTDAIRFFDSDLQRERFAIATRSVKHDRWNELNYFLDDLIQGISPIRNFLPDKVVKELSHFRDQLNILSQLQQIEFQDSELFYYYAMFKRIRQIIELEVNPRLVNQLELKNRIEANVKQIHEVVDDFVSLMEGDISRRKQEIVLKNLLELSFQDVFGRSPTEPHQYGPRIELIFDAPADLKVFGDPRKLQNVFRTIFTNSSQVWSERNKGKTIKDELILKVSVTNQADGPKIQVMEITDTAGGIRDQELLETPDPNQPDRQKAFFINVSRRQGDTGLGLAQVYHLIRLHDTPEARASVRFENVIDREEIKGARFIINLPLVKLGESMGKTSDPTQTSQAEDQAMSSAKALELKGFYESIHAVLKKLGKSGDGWHELGSDEQPFDQQWWVLGDGKFKQAFAFEDGYKPGKVGMGLIQGFKSIKISAAQSKKGKIIGIEFSAKKGKESFVVRWGQENGYRGNLSSNAHYLYKFYKDMKGLSNGQDGWHDLAKPVAFDTRWRSVTDFTDGEFQLSFQFENGHKPGRVSMRLKNVDSIEIVSIQIQSGQFVGMKLKGQKGETVKFSQWGIDDQGYQGCLTSPSYKLDSLYYRIKDDLKGKEGWHKLSKPLPFDQKLYDAKEGKFLEAFSLESGFWPGNSGMGLMTGADFIEVVAAQMKDGKCIGLELKAVKKDEEALARWGEDEEGYQGNLSSARYLLDRLYKDLRIGIAQKDGWQELAHPATLDPIFWKFDKGRFQVAFRFEDGYQPDRVSMGLMLYMSAVKVVAAKYENGKMVAIKFRGYLGWKVKDITWIKQGKAWIQDEGDVFEEKSPSPSLIEPEKLEEQMEKLIERQGYTEALRLLHIQAGVDFSPIKSNVLSEADIEVLVKSFWPNLSKMKMATLGQLQFWLQQIMTGINRGAYAKQAAKDEPFIYPDYTHRLDRVVLMSEINERLLEKKRLISLLRSPSVSALRKEKLHRLQEVLNVGVLRLLRLQVKLTAKSMALNEEELQRIELAEDEQWYSRIEGFSGKLKKTYEVDGRLSPRYIEDVLDRIRPIYKTGWALTGRKTLSNRTINELVSGFNSKESEADTLALDLFAEKEGNIRSFAWDDVQRRFKQIRRSVDRGKFLKLLGIYQELVRDLERSKLLEDDPLSRDEIYKIDEKIKVFKLREEILKLILGDRAMTAEQDQELESIFDEAMVSNDSVEAKEVKEIFKKLVTRGKNHYWLEDEELIKSLVGKSLGLTKNGRVHLRIKPGYAYQLPLAGAKKYHDYEVVIKEVRVSDHLVDFVFEFTKGNDSFTRRFQMGQHPHDITFQSNKGLEGLPLEVLALSPKLGMQLIADLVQKPKDFDWLAHKDELPNLIGTLVGKVYAEGSLTVSIDGYDYNWSAIGSHEADWSGEIIDQKIFNNRFEFTIRFSKETGEELIKTYQIGRINKTIKKRSKGGGIKKDETRDVLLISDALGIEALKEILAQDPKQFRLLAYDLEGFNLGESDADGKHLISIDGFYYRWASVGTKEAGWKGTIISSSNHYNFLEFTVLFEKNGQKRVRTFQVTEEKNILENQDSKLGTEEFLNIDASPGLKGLKQLVNGELSTFSNLQGLLTGPIYPYGEILTIFSAEIEKEIGSPLDENSGWNGRIVAIRKLEGGKQEFRIRFFKEGANLFEKIFLFDPEKKGIKRLQVRPGFKLSEKKGKTEVEETEEKFRQILLRPKNHHWLEDKELLEKLLGKSLGITLRGMINLTMDTGYSLQLYLAGAKEFYDYNIIIEAIHILDHLVEFTFRFEKDGEASFKRTLQIGQFGRQIPYHNNNLEGVALEVLDLDSRLGLQGVGNLINRPSDSDWLKLKDLPNLVGMDVGETDAHGDINFTIEGFPFVWHALGTMKKGWKGKVTDQKIFSNRFEFTVSFSKEGEAPVTKFYQIGRIKRGQDILEISDQLGLVSLKEIVSSDFSKLKELAYNLEGLKLGLSEDKGTYYFTIDGFRYDWFALGFGIDGDGWNGIIISSSMHNNVLEFSVEFEKGLRKIVRTFRIQGDTRKSKDYTRPELGTKDFLDIIPVGDIQFLGEELLNRCKDLIFQKKPGTLLRLLRKQVGIDSFLNISQYAQFMLESSRWLMRPEIFDSILETLKVAYAKDGRLTEADIELLMKEAFSGQISELIEQRTQKDKQKAVRLAQLQRLKQDRLRPILTSDERSENDFNAQPQIPKKQIQVLWEQGRKQELLDGLYYVIVDEVSKLEYVYSKMYKQQSISAGAIFVLPQALDSYDPKLHGDSLEIYLRDQLQKRISEIVDEDNEWTGNVSLSAPTQGADSDDDLTLEGLIAAQPPQEQSLSTFVELQERLGVVRVQIEEKSAQLNGHIVHGDQKVKSANDLEKFLQERGILDVLNSQDSEYGVYLSGQWGSWAFTRNDDPIEAVIVINQPHDRLEQMTVEISRKLNAQVISNNGTKELKYKDQGREVRLNIISAEASDEEEMDPLLDIFANAVPVHESRRGVIQDIAGGVFHRFGKRAADQIFGYYLFLSERQGGLLKTFEADSTQQGLIDKAQTSQTEDEAMSTVQATDEKDQPVPITLDPDGVLIDIANIGKKYGLQVQFVGGTARRMLWGQNPLNEKVDFDIALWPMEDQVEDTITRVLSFKGAILKEYPNLKLDILNFKGPNLTEDPYELRRSSPEMTINQIIIENTDTGWKVRDMREGQYILDARNRVIRLSNPLVKGQGFSIRTALRYTRLRAEFPEFTATDNEVFNPFVRKGVLGEGSLDVPLTDVFYKFIKGDIETLEKGRQVNYISPFLSIIMHARDPETLPRLLRSMGSEDVNLFSLYEQVIDINQAIQIEQQNRTRGQESKEEDFDKIFKLDTETKRSYRGDRSKAEFANDMHLFIRQHSPSAEFLDLISREEFNAFLKEELYHNLKKPLLTRMGIIAGIGYFVLLETRIMSLLQIKDLIPRWEGYLAGDFLNHLYAHSVEIEKNARSRTNGYGNLWEYYFKVYLKQRDAQTNVMQMPADQPEDWAMDGLEQSALDMMRELDSAAQLKSVVLKLENYYYKEELSEVKEGDLIKIDLTEWYAEYQRQSNKIIFYSSLERSLSRFALALADHFPGHNHFMSKEVLKNAFVHGNKLKLNQPIYISIDPIAGNRFFIVFDTDEVNFDSKEMALAKDAKIYGEGQAKLMIKMMGGVVTKKKIVGGKAVIVTLPPRIDSFRETKTSQPEDQAMQDQDMAMNVKDRRDKELDILLDETDPITVSELWAKLIRIDGYADVTLKMVKHDISRDNRLEKHPKIKKIATPEEVKDRRDEESSILQKTVNPITARELWAELIEVDGYADVTFKMLQHDIESDGRLKKHPKIKKIATPEEVRTRRAKERNILNNQGNAITVNELWNKLKKIKEYADVTLWMVWNDVQNDSSLNKHTLLNKRNLNPDAILVNMGLTKEKVREMTRQDKAQVVGKGGIDFNADKMNLETRNEGGEISAGGGPASGWKFKLDPAMLEQLQNAPGFYPVIINIQPMLNLREFLGIAEVDPSLRSG